MRKIDLFMTDRYSSAESRRLVQDGSGSMFDRLFKVLSEQRRRYVLYYLQESPTDTATLEELVPKIVDWEKESETSPSESHREEVTIALHHTHLPELDDHGIIDYDTRSKTARYRKEISKQEWLEQVKAEELDQSPG